MDEREALTPNPPKPKPSLDEAFDTFFKNLLSTMQDTHPGHVLVTVSATSEAIRAPLS
jgi:hypothetical protein